MKLVLASSCVPFINGGARFIVEWLEEQLRAYGHEVERFYLPFVDAPEEMLDQIAAYRLMDLSEAGDRLIAFRPPSYVLRHPHKILWFIHHFRAFYDQWGGPYGVPPTLRNQAIRAALMEIDQRSLTESQAVYCNSQVVADRLQHYNECKAQVLYPPIYRPERFRTDGYGDEVVVICRAEPHKRQHLLLEAMAHVRTPVRLRLSGASSGLDYSTRLRELIARHRLQDRVTLEDRWISEEEKVERLAGALALAYAPMDEDSYGYPSLEAAHAAKPVLTTSDAGGVLELVQDGHNGLVSEPSPQALAAALDQLYRDRAQTQKMGEANRARLAELRIDWTRVVEAFTQ